MSCTPTEVNAAKLAEYKERLPPRLARFVDDFFTTCYEFEPEQNFVNYRLNLLLFGQMAGSYREHRTELMDAFYEITGWKPRPTWPEWNGGAQR